MFRTEESKTSAFVLFTFALLLLALVFDMYVLIGTTIILLALLLYITFVRLWSRNVGRDQDERSARCSLTATRNGFIVAIMLLALLTVAAQIRPLPFSMVDVLSMIWGISVGVYLVTYHYYKNISLGKEWMKHV